jgi:hypothetical protein
MHVLLTSSDQSSDWSIIPRDETNSDIRAAEPHLAMSSPSP